MNARIKPVVDSSSRSGQTGFASTIRRSTDFRRQNSLQAIFALKRNPKRLTWSLQTRSPISAGGRWPDAAADTGRSCEVDRYGRATVSDTAVGAAYLDHIPPAVCQTSIAELIRTISGCVDVPLRGTAAIVGSCKGRIYAVYGMVLYQQSIFDRPLRSSRGTKAVAGWRRQRRRASPMFPRCRPNMRRPVLLPA